MVRSEVSEKMDTLFWVKKGNEKPQEFSKDVAGGGRSDAIAPAVFFGTTRVPHKDVERLSKLDFIKPASKARTPLIEQRLLMTPKKMEDHKCCDRMENIPDECNYVREQSLKFI